MSGLKAQQVFIPGGFPVYTYVERSDKQYELELKDAISIPGQVVSLAGPSKSGKTVLVEKVVGRDNLISVTGAGVSNPEQLWDRVLNWMETPHEVNTTSKRDFGGKVGGEVKGEVGIPGSKVQISARAELQNGRSVGGGQVIRRRGLQQIVSEIGGSEFAVLIDDFHYITREAQIETAKQIKDAARQGVQFITASVLHRSDDVVRALPELRGRVTTVDLDYWNIEDLRKIAADGFSVLNFEANEESISAFSIEAAGSPQLMQSISLATCFFSDVREKAILHRAFSFNEGERRKIFERVAMTADFRTLVDVLDSGPKVRGVERKIYDFNDDTSGDVYRCVLKALASDPPKLSFPYQEIADRVESICRNDKPVGSSIFGSCSQMARLAIDNFPNERAIDWDEQKQVLDIPDPYLMFYLRWSERLMESE